MRSAARRVPRKIGQNDDDDDDDRDNALHPSVHQDVHEPVVKRPTNVSRTSSKPRKSSKLRTSFASLELPRDDADNSSITLTSRLARESGQRSAHLPVISPDRSNFALASLNSRPSYNFDHLSALKNSTPTTPPSADIERSDTSTALQPQHLDIDSKFGDGTLALAIIEDSADSQIPSAAEIREKKERRRRLAKENDYISLNQGSADAPTDVADDDSENDDPRSRSLIIPAEEYFKPQKYAETRLVHEDEDIAEGFDEFVEDQGRVTLGRKAAKEQERQRRKDIEDQIRSAQHGYGYAAGLQSSDESAAENDEDATRNAAYDAAQARAGTYSIGNRRANESDKEERLKKKLELPKLKAVPEFKEIVAQFASMVNMKHHNIELNRKRLMRLEREQQEIEKDETRLKGLLSEAADRYDRLQAEAVGKSVDISGSPIKSGSESLTNVITPVGASTRQGPDDRMATGDHNLPMTEVELTGQDDLRIPSGMAQIATEEEEYSN